MGGIVAAGPGFEPRFSIPDTDVHCNLNYKALELFAEQMDSIYSFCTYVELTPDAHLPLKWQTPR